MSIVNKINVSGTEYDIRDSQAGLDIKNGSGVFGMAMIQDGRSSHEDEYRAIRYQVIERKRTDQDYAALTARKACDFVMNAKVVLDGTANCTVQSQSGFTNTLLLRYTWAGLNAVAAKQAIGNPGTTVICGALPSQRYLTTNGDVVSSGQIGSNVSPAENYQQKMFAGFTTQYVFVMVPTQFRVGGTDASPVYLAQDKEAALAYLKEHPITIYYQTETVETDQNVYIAIPAGDFETIPETEYTPGFLGSDGMLNSPTENSELISGKLYGLKRVIFKLAYSETRSMWLAVCAYAADGTHLGRTALIPSLSNQYRVRCYDVPAEAAYIRYSFRSFDDYTLDIAAEKKLYDGSGAVTSEQLYEPVYHSFQIGSISDGNNLTRDKRIRSTSFVRIQKTSYMVIKALPSDMWTGLAINYYDSSKQYLGNDLNLWSASGMLTVPDTEKILLNMYDAAYVRFVVRAQGDRVMTEDDISFAEQNIVVYNLAGSSRMAEEVEQVTLGRRGYNVLSINHRGFSDVAPENTLPAFKLSKKHGFEWVECDVQFTSDNVPVLLHDRTIYRTGRNADGTELAETVSINSITYEQVLTYDFGIWKSTEYAGTKIPTFDQMMALCRNIGLKVNIELKQETVTTDKIPALVAIVKKYGMEEHVNWISFGADLLSYISQNYPTYSVERVATTITDSIITATVGLRTASNKVRIMTSYANLTSEIVDKLIAVGLPVGVYTITNASQVTGIDPYVSGYTSNQVLSGAVLYEYGMNN